MFIVLLMSVLPTKQFQVAYSASLIERKETWNHGLAQAVFVMPQPVIFHSWI